jgi:glycosyltransferase involved in cell wall biosynthesis
MERPFEIAHHVTYAVFRNPSYLYLLDIPFIFGPVGGGESSPHALRLSMSKKGKAFEAVRDIVNLLPHIDPFWRSMLKRCARIVVKTKETRACLSRQSIDRSVITLENMLSGPPHLAGEIDRVPPLKLLFAGRLLPWKGVHLAVQAMALLSEQIPVKLTIVGKGKEESRLKEEVRRLHLEQLIDFVPWMPKAEFLTIYAKHDALLFPSLHDSGGTVVMEALAHGKPVICLDLGGPATTVDEHCARVVNTKDMSEIQVIREMARAIRELAQMSPEEWLEIRRAAVCRAAFYAPDLVIGRVYGPLLKPNAALS